MIKIINVYKDTRVMEMTSSSNLGLGVKTDNDVDLLRFTFDEMIVGTATLLTTLTDDNGDLVAFPLTYNEEENSYDLEVTNYVASQTNYTIQLEIVKDEMIWHSKQADIILDECLEVGTGEMPTTVENWLQNANLVMSGYQDKIDEWEQDVEQAVSSAENVNIEVEEGQDLYNVTITDRDGNEYQAVIYQGANAIISGATASVDQTIGAPSVNVTMGGTESDRTFDFAFHNLKGEQGEQGEKGEPGAIKMQIVDELPPTGSDDTIYLVPITPDTSGNNYAEYVYINGAWEQLGKIGVQLDLTDYVKNTDYATSNVGGVIKVDTYYNLELSNGALRTQTIAYSNYGNKSNYSFISKGTLENVITGKNLETANNKVTSITSSSTDIQYPSAKCVYDSQATQDTKITNLENQVFGEETIEGEGTSITLDGTLKGQFNELGLKGNTSQDGTPTPSSPIPVNVVSGDNSITINGKNWFDNSINSSTGSTGSQETISTGKRIKYTGATAQTGAVYVFYVIKDLTNYVGKTIRAKMNFQASGSNNGRFYIGLSSSSATNRSAKATGTSSGSTISFVVPTLSEGQDHLILALYANATGTAQQNDYVDYTDIIITIDNDDMTYKPYNGDTYNIDLPVENLLELTNGEQGGIDTEGNLVSNANLWRSANYINVLPNTIYTISINPSIITTNYVLRIYEYNESQTFISPRKQGSDRTPIFTFTTGVNTKYLKYNIYIASTTMTQDIINSITPQIEQGSKANSYTPYGTTPIELCKIGNYQDYFYKDSDKWYLHKEIGKVVLDGSEDNWTYESSSRWEFRRIFSDIMPFTNLSTSTELPNIISNYFATSYWNNTNNNGTMTGMKDINTTISFANTDITSLANWKTWLGTNNVTLYYPLSTPTNTEITYQPLIDQLNLLEKAQSKENQTNISQVNNDLPFIINASAFLNNINGKIALLNKLTEV